MRSARAVAVLVPILVLICLPKHRATVRVSVPVRHVSDGLTGERSSQGEAHGQGTQTWPNGDRYEGAWQDGKRHGTGKSTLANGERYYGPYKNDKRHGKGLYEWPNGDRFEGEYVAGRREGNGLC